MAHQMNKTFAIDGRQLVTGVHGGVQRFLAETLAELDKIAAPGDYEIVIPADAQFDSPYQNIPVVRSGKLRNLLWEQVSLPLYLHRNHRYGIYPCSVVPFFYCKGIAVLHDIMFKTVPMVASSLNPFLRLLLTSNFRTAAKHATLVGSGTDYSRQDIVKTYHLDPDKVVLIGDGWQHFDRVEPDDGWMQKHPELIPGEFYFSLSANRIQKNFKWIYEVAKRSPERLFVMAGTQEEWQKQIEYDAPNLVHLGFISDGEVRSLMSHCRAFLFPSLYEGFGIPPLEALSAGARIIIARSSCLPEIYQDAAYYIDPYDYEVDLDALLQQPVAPPDKVLAYNSWANAAKHLDDARKRILSEHP